MADAQTLSVTGRVGYGIGISGLWMVFMTTAFYLLYFYTDVIGLSPSQAGLIIFIATLWDGITDPLMGWLASRTRSRWGQYRPFLVLGALPLSIAFVFMFARPDWAAGQLFMYALITQLLFRTTFTIVYIPYTALIARLSTDADERASIASVKAFFVSLGTLTVSFFGLPLVRDFGGGDDVKGFFLTALLFSCLSAVTLLICGAVTRETDIAGPAKQGDTSSVVEAVKVTLKNPAFLIVFFGVIIFTGCYTTLNKTTVYFFQYNLGARENARWALSAISLAGLISPFLWVKVTHKTSKRATWILGSFLAATALTYLYFAMPRSVVVITVIYFVTGCGIQAFLMTFYAMTADAVDYGEYLTGVRVEAIGFGFLSFANKTSLAIGGGLLGWLLGEIGYTPGAEQSAQTLESIRKILVFIPAGGFLLSAAVIAFFPVSTQRHKQAIAAIQARSP
ncbi:MAG: glycoside-pentoside-hexuronide (GPH):cation symporter [Pseudomonadota bacterium]